MAYAIVETGGKQLRVEPGRFYDVERLHTDPEETVTLDRVLYIQNNDDIQIGQPFVAGATVEAIVMRHLRGKKVIVYKMRPKKKTRKKQGHRQELTRLMINAIHVNGSVLSADEQLEVVQPILAAEPEPVVSSTPEAIVEEAPPETAPVESSSDEPADATVEAEQSEPSEPEIADSAEESSEETDNAS